MHTFLLDYGLFLAQAATIVVAIAIVLALMARLVVAARGSRGREGLEVRDLNRELGDAAESLQEALLDRRGPKRYRRQRKAKDKARRAGADRPRLFVLDFKGDLAASRTAALRHEISAILQVATPQDEVLLRLESSGGMVHGYGLAASQLHRLREHGVPLTVAVDKVAASGGYMMACVANRIIAAPFAVLGSIGVVGQLPNFHRWLQKNDIDMELHTAGEYKRTLTMFGENTEAARTKFLAELEDTHALFKAFVADHRPQVPLNEVATGAHWYGSEALGLRLVDALQTSDDYLLQRGADRGVYGVRWRVRHTLWQRLSGSTAASTSLAAAVARLWRGPRN
ncbi:MAG TPA: protease SohB [Nevskiaceae bacterium]